MTRVRLIKSANPDIPTGMEGTVDFIEFHKHKNVMYVHWDNDTQIVLNVPPDQVEELKE